MQQIGKTLYAANKNNGTKQWAVYTDGDQVITEYGQEGGKLTQKTTTSVAKNAGKKSATTPEEQATKEALAKYQKQIKKGYVENKSEMGQLTLPPLAEKFQDSKENISYPAHISFKLDGVRMTAFYRNGEVVFQSRGGESYPVIKEIADELIKVFFANNPKLVIDGELYRHGMFLEDIVAAVKKPNKDTPRIKFHIFDCYNPNKPDEPFVDRYFNYKTYLAGCFTVNRLEGLWQGLINRDVEVYTQHQLCVDEGYEGVVIRNRNSKFKFNHRTSDFQKYKVQMDEEFLVVGWVKGKNGSVSAVCQLNTSEETFKAPMRGSLEYQAMIFDRYPQQVYGTVVFEKYSKYGVPTKPKFKCFRDVDKDGEPCE